MHKLALVWLRRDLRLEDHAALYLAAKEAAAVLPVFIFDTAILGSLPAADRRVEFIWETVAGLKAELQARGSDLVVRHGLAEAEIPALAEALGATAVVCAHDYEPAAIARDGVVRDRLAARGIEFLTIKDQVVFERDEVLTASGTPFSVFTPYRNAWMRQLAPFYLKAYPTAAALERLARREPEPIPALEDIGFVRTNLKALGVQAGAEGGNARVADFLRRIDRYKTARDFPGVKGVSYLSVHLRFGTVSIRTLARIAWQQGTEGAMGWLNELIWRDFYHQILWHRPDVVGHAFKPEYDDLPFPNDPALFQAWCEGRTGYPLVDAAMRQMNQTGYMHNRLRMVAASFLVKDLLVDWRWGERYFAEVLIDFDLAANNGGWQWAASTGCDAQPYFRIFNPVSQSEKFDPDGAFIRRYVPELAGLTAPAIHAPWKHTLGKHGGAVGYPQPIVDHAVQRDRVLALFKTARSGGET